MLRWFAPRVPPRRYRLDLHSLALDNGLSKVEFKQGGPATSPAIFHSRQTVPSKERRVGPHPLMVYNSLPPAPRNSPLEPNSSLCPPFHIHLHEDETFQVLSGRAKFLLVNNDPQHQAQTQNVGSSQDEHLLAGVTTCILHEGSSITIPRGKIHTFRNASTTSRLELQFGFSQTADMIADKPGGEGLPESASFEMERANQASEAHLAPMGDPTKEHADLLESLTGSSDIAAGANRQGPDSRLISSPSSKLAMGPSSQQLGSTRLNSCLVGHDQTSSTPLTPLSSVLAGSAPEISNKMLKFFLNTQLYRSDCTSHAIPRSLAQVLLFNHAAGVVLIPPWLLNTYVRFRILRPLISSIGRTMNILIGVVWGRWICGLQDMYVEYTQPASIETMVEQAEEDVKKLQGQISQLETQFAREKAARVTAKEIEDSGLMCSAWKGHEFDGQDENWRKNV